MKQYKLAERYKNSIQFWEVWNEEDWMGYWRPKANPHLYTKLLKISDLDHFCKTVFPYETLNQIQSLVYPVAYKTNENINCVDEKGDRYTSHKDFEIKNLINNIDTIEEMLLTNWCVKKEVSIEIEKMKNKLNELLIDKR